MSEELLVRVYNVGCGDCIFVRIPDRDFDRFILIDCGNFFGDRSLQLRHAMGNVKTLLQSEDRPDHRRGVLDLVIATHQHWDHLKGFEAALETFRQIQIERIWISTAMLPDHPQAEGLRSLRNHLDRTLQALVQQRGMALQHGLYEQMLNSLSTLEATRAITEIIPAHHNIEPLYVYRGIEPELNDEQRNQEWLNFDDPSIKIHILAPERDIDGAYMGLAGNMLDALQRGEARVLENIADSKSTLWPANLSRSEFRRLRAHLQHTSLLAASLENNVVNNTSVAILLEWRGRRLLFPGDAEHESWRQMWVHARQHLSRPLDFLKISHHGSHNGTPFVMDDVQNELNPILETLLPRANSASAKAIVTTLDGRIRATHNPVPFPQLMNELAARIANGREYPEAMGLQPQRTDFEDQDWIDATFAAADQTGEDPDSGNRPFEGRPDESHAPGTGHSTNRPQVRAE